MHKWIMSGVVAFAGMLAVFLLLTGLPEKEPPADSGPAFTVPDRAVDAEASMQIYQSMCLSCHGTDLQGAMGPALDKVGSSLTKEQLYTIISDGRRNMPAFEDRLTEDELITITTWLASYK